MTSNARTAALQALLHVDENEGYSNIVIDKTLRRFSLEPRDAALATALFYGVLERRIALDYVIEAFPATAGSFFRPRCVRFCGSGYTKSYIWKKYLNRRL